MNLARYSVDLMMVIDREGAITWSNDTALVGERVLERVHPDDDARGLLVGETVRHRWRDPDGSYRMLETVGRDLHDEPSVRGVLLQSRDVTAAAQLEAMMTESNDAAYELAALREDLIEKLRQLDHSKQQLSAALVHDLKTPLTVILMTAKYVAEDIGNPEYLNEHSETIGRAADTMHRMVLDLLDIGRSEDGQLVAKIGDIDPAALLAEHGARAKPLLVQRKQTMAIESAGALRGDADLLARVIQNLIDNCTKYAPQGTEIAAFAGTVDDHFELVISDRGPGIPDEFKTKIFELYTRLDRDARASARTSRGVGLAFCKLAIEAHGGTIVVEDREGGGSVFRCRW